MAAANPPDPNVELSLDVAKRFHRGWYLLVLARAEARLEQTGRAVFHLEDALLQTFPQDDPQLYSQVLQALQQLYFQQANYLEAFRTKQTQRGIEHQYGFRAFVGALRLQPPQILTGSPAIAPPQKGTEGILSQEITASGRQRDVKHLIDRMGRNDYKLTVIHGPSGVGKSSIVTAGFVPALKDRVIGDRVALPLVVDIYTDWLTMLDRHLKPFQETMPLDVEGRVDPSQMLFPAPESILQKLSEVTSQGLLPILIFDQFEEFFFAYETLQQRRFFYDFLCACLNLPFVKIVLSIREDYLHYLLEIQRTQSLDIINNDILSKDIRYPLGDLLPEDAKSVIKNLTNQAQFYLDDDLVDELVRDLAGELGEVRPIELQVVGAELQAEDIRTLRDYRRFGPKEKLVERSLQSVVKDCGPENEKTARLVLFLLTNPNGTRPLKTRDELVADLMALQLTEEVEKLDLVLEVLAGSGLVFLVPETPAERYQLVHDYLVSFIRQQQESDVMGLKLELDQERLHRKMAEERQKASEEQLSEVLKKQLELARTKVFQLTVFGLALGAMAIVAVWAATEAVIRTEDAEEAKHAAEAQAKELQVINQELQVTRNRANRAETEVQAIRGLMSATQPFLEDLKPSPERSPTATPLSTPFATPTLTPSPSPSPSGLSRGSPSPTMTQDEAVAVVKQWLAAKHKIFAPPYDQQLAATLTTGPLYADLTRPGGSIDWLMKNNSFYRYGAQTIDAVIQFTIEGTVPTLDVSVTEDGTLYLRNRRARPDTTQKSNRFRYRFEFVGDRWKILDYTTLP